MQATVVPHPSSWGAQWPAGFAAHGSGFGTQGPSVPASSPPSPPPPPPPPVLAELDVAPPSPPPVELALDIEAVPVPVLPVLPVEPTEVKNTSPDSLQPPRQKTPTSIHAARMGRDGKAGPRGSQYPTTPRECDRGRWIFRDPTATRGSRLPATRPRKRSAPPPVEGTIRRSSQRQPYRSVPSASPGCIDRPE